MAERLFCALIFRNLPQDFLFPARGFFVFSRKNLHFGIWNVYFPFWNICFALGNLYFTMRNVDFSGGISTFLQLCVRFPRLFLWKPTVAAAEMNPGAIGAERETAARKRTSFLRVLPSAVILLFRNKTLSLCCSFF